MLQKSSGKKEKRKTKGEKRAEASAQKFVKERNRLKLLKMRKKLRKLGSTKLTSKKSKASEFVEEDIEAGIYKTDAVGFGEVVQAPPLLEHKPRKAEKKTNRVGNFFEFMFDFFLAFQVRLLEFVLSWILSSS